MNHQDNQQQHEAAAEEQWRPVCIDGHETRYEVSDQGSVRSRHTKKFKREDGRVERREVQYILKPRRKSNGYMDIYISHEHSVNRKHVHRLVAAAFLGPCPKGYEVDHINGDPTDNRLENLRYVTSKENISNRKKPTGKSQKGKRCFQPLFSLHIQPDGFDISYRCLNWRDFHERTGASIYGTKIKLTVAPDRRIHLRCGFTVWQEPICQD